MKQKCCGYGIDTFSNDGLRYLPIGNIIETAIISDMIRARELARREKCPNAGKYGPEKTPYLDTFHAV